MCQACVGLDTGAEEEKNMQVVSERGRDVSPTVSVRRIEQNPFTYWLEKFWTEDHETYRLGVVTRSSNFRQVLGL